MTNLEISVTFLEEPMVKDTIQVSKKIGTGRLSVYQVFAPSRNNTYALKIFPKDSQGTTRYYREKLMFHLNHVNVIQNIPIVCHDDRFHGLLTEYAKYGDFFELVKKGIFTNEVLARTYFHQLIEGLEYIHSQGVAHLDLKLENLMLGSDFLLKIIDFDQAQPIADKEICSGGTRDYRAPEVKDRTCNNLGAADIYAAGMVLYALKTQEILFWESEEYDEKGARSYSCFQKDNKGFWKTRAELKRDKKYFCKDFIELINGMVHKSPSKRFTIKDVKNSKWYKGPILNMKILKAEMTIRLDYMTTKN